MAGRQGRQAWLRRSKLATVNGEWMNDWFTLDAESVGWRDTFQEENESVNVETVAAKLAGMIKELDADVIALQEGPSRQEELALLCTDFLNANGSAASKYSCLLSDHGGQQHVGLLWRSAKLKASLVPRDKTLDQSLLGEWEADADGDAVLDLYGFTRHPLVCNLEIDGETAQIIVAHLKSNFVNRGESMWNNPNAPRLRARGNQEPSPHRDRINEDPAVPHEDSPAAAPQARVIVLGDLNDGPGQDYFEEKYLAHNVTDILVGSAYQPGLAMIHAQRDVPEAQRYTAVFDDFVEQQPDRKLPARPHPPHAGLPGRSAHLQGGLGSGRARGLGEPADGDRGEAFGAPGRPSADERLAEHRLLVTHRQPVHDRLRVSVRAVEPGDVGRVEPPEYVGDCGQPAGESCQSS